MYPLDPKILRGFEGDRKDRRALFALRPNYPSPFLPRRIRKGSINWSKTKPHLRSGGAEEPLSRDPPAPFRRDPRRQIPQATETMGPQIRTKPQPKKGGGAEQYLSIRMVCGPEKPRALQILARRAAPDETQGPQRDILPEKCCATKPYKQRKRKPLLRRPRPHFQRLFNEALRKGSKKSGVGKRSRRALHSPAEGSSSWHTWTGWPHIPTCSILVGVVAPFRLKRL